MQENPYPPVFPYPPPLQKEGLGVDFFVQADLQKGGGCTKLCVPPAITSAVKVGQVRPFCRYFCAGRKTRPWSGSSGKANLEP